MGFSNRKKKGKQIKTFTLQNALISQILLNVIWTQR